MARDHFYTRKFCLEILLKPGTRENEYTAKVLALHAGNLNLILGTPHMIKLGMIPEHRVKRKMCILLGVTPKQTKTQHPGRYF